MLLTSGRWTPLTLVFSKNIWKKLLDTATRDTHPLSALYFIPFFASWVLAYTYVKQQSPRKNLGVNRLMVIYDTKSSVINVMDDKKHNHVTEASSFIFM